MKYIDIHCHLNFPEYDSDRDGVISRAQEEEVGMIIVGTDLESSKKAIEIAERYENIWATVGMHPTETAEAFEYEKFLELAKNKKVVGIGECGLDYFRADENSFKKQEEIFIEHIKLANEVKKPLMLHIRSSKDKNAYKDAFEIVKAHAKVLGNLHFFAGSMEDAKLYLGLGFTFSFTGVITFARNYDEIIKFLPSESLMSETDAPYVSPDPFRGKRNEPIYVREVVKKIEEIRGDSEENIGAQIIDNARKMFAI